MAQFYYIWNLMLMAAAYKRIGVYLGIIAFTALFLMPFLGSVHLLDSDEAKYAESAREMLVTGDYLTVQIDYEPFPEKPPLFFWLQAISMKIFGINEFAARFPNIICGFVSLILLYYLGRQLYGHRFGLLWILSYGSAILPFFFFKSGIIDPWFNLFILMGVAWFIFYLDPDRGKYRMSNVVLSALFFGLAVLTKGPVALLIFLLCFLVYLAIHRFRMPTRAIHVVAFILVVFLTGGSWFLIQILNGNTEMVRDFVAYQVRFLFVGSSFHDGFFGYHLVVLLLGVFPASVIAMKSFTKKAEDTELQKLFRQWMYIMFWVVIILFTIVRTKLIHYSSLAYFPLTFLAAWVWEKWLDRKIEIGNWQVILIFLVSIFLGSVAILFPLITDHYDWLMEKDFAFLDPFIRGALQRNVHWSGYEWIIGTFLLMGVIVACVQILRRNRKGMLILHLVVLVFTTASIYTFTPRVEGYAQRATIKFYKGLKGQDVYVNTLGFKSYSHLFYFDKQPTGEEDGLEYLTTEVLDKDAYFVIRIDKKERYLERYPELEVLHEKDGYVFTVKRAGKRSE
jgi:4-amino-4-deoxy-L-arabinose transferase-like glycosyltransferase